ncbi:MAG: tetratricopeptide repeat protein [Anaerolineae bacterium]|nr:tetratricopeptide repeat protein [Anaerolineae bacterium]
MQNHFESMGDHVFISYARADAVDFAAKLHDDLESNNVRAWLDQRDIKPGQNFRIAIDKGLLAARVVIVLLSPVSVLSDEVTSEWNDALSRFVPVIPLMVADCRVPPNLAILQYIDFRGDYDKALARLLDRLAHVEENHLAYLEDRLKELEAAQQSIADPETLSNRIVLLKSAIAYYSRGTLITAPPDAPPASPEVPARAPIYAERRKSIGYPVAVISHFHDRKAQQAQIQKLLADPATRLVSLIGRAGIGKSGLVTKVLGDILLDAWEYLDADAPRPSFGGIIYISTRTRGLSVERIFLDSADLLGGEQQSIIRNLWRSPDFDLETKTVQLLDHFRDGLYIILLDNVEDVQDAQGALTDSDLYHFIEKALHETHNLKLLVTTRLPLALGGDLEKLDKRVRLEDGLPTDDGVAMLRELDHNGEAHFLNEDAAKLAQAATLVHGVPRALEILFSICKQDPFMTLDELIEQHREHPEIENLVADNYKRLDGSARFVLDALAVFARPAPLPALEFMLQPFAPDVPVRQTVDRLWRMATISVDRPTRTVNLHPIDRDYIYGALPASGDYSRYALEVRAAAYYVTQRLPAEQWQRIDDFEAQLNEFDHRVRAGEYESAFDLLDSFDDNLLAWGHFDRLIDMRRRLDGTLSSTETMFINIMRLGNVYLTRREMRAALDHYHRALALPQSEVNAGLLAKLHLNIVSAYLSQGQLDEGEEHNRIAMGLIEAHGDPRNLAAALQNAVVLNIFRGNYPAALEAQERVQTVVDALNDPAMQTRSLSNLIQLYNQLGRFEEGLKALEAGLPVVRSTHNKTLIAGVLANKGAALHGSGRVAEAVSAYQEVLEIARELGDRQLEATMLTNMGLAAADQGNFTEAERYQEQALVVVREIGHRVIEANIFDNIGLIYQQQGRFAEAITQFEQALAIANEVNDPVGQQTFQQHIDEARQKQSAQGDATE